jgi:hypothetical protein
MKYIRFIVGLMLFSFAFYNWWMLSRMTVDDSFITWRYGKNLVEFGIWNYNPSALDMTQAYTNPIYAILSIVPAALGMDMVLFFKILSTLMVLGFFAWYFNKTKCDPLFLLLFFALPASFVHVYAGLETFLFTALMTAQLIFLYERNIKSSVYVALILILTRPEAWLLVALVPIYFLLPPINRDGRYKESLALLQRLDIRSALWCFVVLVAAISAYFIFHFYHFGSILPNTFYVKKSALFDYDVFYACLLFTSPLIFLLVKGRYGLALLLALFFGAMSYKYAASLLVMNYFGRFYYHIFAPLFLFSVYLVSSGSAVTNVVISRSSASRQYSFSDKTLLILWLVFLVHMIDSKDAGFEYYVSQYDRGLYSHAAIGKTLKNIANQYGVRSFAIGDAGMAAYHSGMNNLDTLLLGSSKATRYGLSESLFEEYGIDVVAFHSTPEQVHKDGFNQRPLYDWVIKNDFIDHCFVLLGGDYGFRLYARKNIKELYDLCAESTRQNARTNREFALEALLNPPWNSWHE